MTDRVEPIKVEVVVDDRTEPVAPLEPCGVCGRAADGFASVNGVRVCHSDERSCYAP